MGNRLEELEHNMVKITMEIAPDAFESAIDRVYRRNRGEITVPGFRRGKAPRKLVERTYGKEIFYEDALNDIIPDTYESAVKELDVKVASRPRLDVEKIEDGKDIVVNATVAVRPEVVLGAYKNLGIAKDTVVVTDDDVEEDIHRTAERNARILDVEDGPAQMDDTVTIDYEGFVDGTAFEGGKDTDHPLVLGSHTFVDTFEDQLVGKMPGEACEVSVTFPEDYHQKDLAGKEALFNVTVKKIQRKELPAIDDEFAQDVSEYETLDEYKADVRSRLRESRQAQADSRYRSEVLARTVENAQMDIPEAMIEDQVENTIRNFANNLLQQGMTLERYLELSNSNINSLRSSVRPDAEKYIRESLVLGAVAKAENIEASDEEYEKELADMALAYNMEADKLRETLTDEDKENILEQIRLRKAMDLLQNA